MSEREEAKEVKKKAQRGRPTSPKVKEIFSIARERLMREGKREITLSLSFFFSLSLFTYLFFLFIFNKLVCYLKIIS